MKSILSAAAPGAEALWAAVDLRLGGFGELRLSEMHGFLDERRMPENGFHDGGRWDGNAARGDGHAS